MEELQDAIEDAQYVSAIASQDDGPKPLLPWEIPTPEQLSAWTEKVGADKLTSFDWVLQSAIGYFLFSSFIKTHYEDYTRINFCEHVLRFHCIQSEQQQYERAQWIVENYLSPKPIDENNEHASDNINSNYDQQQQKEKPPKTSILQQQQQRSSKTTSTIQSNNSAHLNHSQTHPTQPQAPPRSEINECDLRRTAVSNVRNSINSSNADASNVNNNSSNSSFGSSEQLDASFRLGVDYPICSETYVGLKGHVVDDIKQTIHKFDTSYQLLKTDSMPVIISSPMMKTRPKERGQLLENNNEEISSNQNIRETSSSNLNTPTRVLDRAESSTPLKAMHVSSTKRILPTDLFDKAEALVMESLRRQYWDLFLVSNEYRKLTHFLWYQDRPVVPEDFFVMRVLGRGGFGLVTACKKGTSGKLYAMKVINKRRIKMKKSEQLALNERQALAAVESSFVVNLKYSFHSKDDVYLILDLMTGGDLGYHLHQKGRFPKKECLYYSARIMLGLQALHDKKYVFRDLKPENCLLADDGRVKLTDLGLATKITSTLHGAAGTRGYWAPEMLRRDKRGRRLTYGHAVDWFSFGCCLAEFISGTNPFRSEAALNFGTERGNQTKEKAIDCATMEMEPELPSEYFEPDAADLCRRLFDKHAVTRLGYNGCEEIMSHPWFKSVNWESIVSDRKRPPFVPPKDVNAASQSEIGTFSEDKIYQETVLTEEDEKIYNEWDWTNPHAFATEVIEFLIYERETGKPLIPMPHHASCCCNII